MTSEPIHDGHYQRYRRKALPRTTPVSQTSKTLTCPDPGAFSIVEEVFWILVVAAQLGWPLPMLMRRQLRGVLDHRFHVDALRFLIRKEPQICVLHLAAAGAQVRHVAPEWACDRLRAQQAAAVSHRDDPQFGPWPEPTQAAETVWEDERRALSQADEATAVSSMPDRIFWLALALAQAGWPMPAAVTRRFPAFWVNRAVPATRLDKVLGSQPDFSVADAVLAGVRVEGLTVTTVVRAVERQLGAKIVLTEPTSEYAFEHLRRNFAPKQLEKLDLDLLAVLAQKMRGILIGRDQNSGQRLTFDTFLFWRNNGAAAAPAPAVTSAPMVSGPDEEGSAHVAVKPTTPATAEPTHLGEEHGRSDVGDQLPDAKPQPSTAPAEPPEIYAEIERRIQEARAKAAQQEKRRLAEQSAHRAGLIGPEETDLSLEKIERRLAIHKEESDRQLYRQYEELEAGLAASPYAKGGRSSLIDDEDNVEDESDQEAEDDEDRADHADRSSPALANVERSATDVHVHGVKPLGETIADHGTESQDSNSAAIKPGTKNAPDDVWTSGTSASPGKTQSEGSALAGVNTSPPEIETEQAALHDLAVLRRRLELPLSEEQEQSLPVGWDSVILSQARIVELVPYPRVVTLDAALTAFGHAPFRSLDDCDKATAAVLEGQADVERQRLRDIVNSEEPKVISSRHEILGAGTEP